MASILQYVALLLALALLGAGGYGMHLFFGTMGVVLLLVFTVPIVAIVLFLSGGAEAEGGGSATTHRESKGARDR